MNNYKTVIGWSQQTKAELAYSYVAFQGFIQEHLKEDENE